MLKQILIVLAGLFAASSFKYLPLVYFARFYIVPIRYLGFGRSKSQLAKFKEKAKNPLWLFESTPRYTYCSPMECDFFGFHKNNCTYQTELDIARLEVMLDKFYPFLLHYKETKGVIPFIPLATIAIYFLKEILPFQKYRIENYVYTWDDKWIFLLSEFKVGSRTMALSIGKMVMKDGRKTIKPQEALEYLGFVGEEVEKVRLGRLANVTGFVDPKALLESVGIEKQIPDGSAVAEEKKEI